MRLGLKDHRHRRQFILTCQFLHLRQYGLMTPMNTVKSANSDHRPPMTRAQIVHSANKFRGLRAHTPPRPKSDARVYSRATNGARNDASRAAAIPPQPASGRKLANRQDIYMPDATTATKPTTIASQSTARGRSPKPAP